MRWSLPSQLVCRCFFFIISIHSIPTVIHFLSTNDSPIVMLLSIYSCTYIYLPLNAFYLCPYNVRSHCVLSLCIRIRTSSQCDTQTHAVEHCPVPFHRHRCALLLASSITQSIQQRASLVQKIVKYPNKLNWITIRSARMKHVLPMYDTLLLLSPSSSPSSIYKISFALSHSLRHSLVYLVFFFLAFDLWVCPCLCESMHVAECPVNLAPNKWTKYIFAIKKRGQDCRRLQRHTAHSTHTHTPHTETIDRINTANGPTGRP